jgi:hypothetical protein
MLHVYIRDTVTAVEVPLWYICRRLRGHACIRHAEVKSGAISLSAMLFSHL